MAIHAGLGRWNVGEAGLLHRGVAVPAVDSLVADVMRVAERDGLLSGYVGLGCPGRSAQRAEEPQQESDEEHGPKDAHFRERVRAGMKDLGHTGCSARCSERELQPGFPRSL